MLDFCAGVVTFQPDIIRLEQNLESVTQQVAQVYIIDNHSENIRSIHRLAATYRNVIIIENNDNYGIAKALNQMSKQALCDGFSWILTLDQDSVIPDNLIETITPYIKDYSIGIICPAVYYEGWNKTLKGNNEAEYIKACMTSASLTRLEAWNRVGGYREDYFIDFVDNEFCMKLELNGYRILRVNGCIMKHQLGIMREFRIFGKSRIRLSVHSPQRFYYMVRNNRVFISDYRKQINGLKEICKLWYIIVIGIFTSNQRIKTLKYVYRGYKDAIYRKMGKLQEY